MKTQPTKIIIAALVSLVFPLLADASNISLVAGDTTVGTSSFNTGLNWAGGLAPSAGNDYFTAGFFMRTPGNTTTAFTFGGNSLTLGTANLSGGVNGSMLEKFSSGAGSVRTLTINNLTNTAGAMIRSGGTAGALIHISGNHYAIAGSSIIQADQCIWVIDSPLLGGDNIILTNFANNANDHVSYDGTNSGFTGSWYLTGAGTSAWSLELDGLYSLPANPSSFNPGQITFLGTGQLRDTVGCALTNSNGGITFAANATFNTSATTLIGEPITDVTNGVSSVSSLTSSGTGTLILSNANNNYSGGTAITAGNLQLGVANSVPAPATPNVGDVSVSSGAVFDLNTHSETVNGLNGAGTVDNTTGGSPTLTIGFNGDSGTFSGNIQNSSGTMSVTKIGVGTETVSGAYTISGSTMVASGTLNLATASGTASTPGSFIISNGATMTANTSLGNPLPATSVLVVTNSTLSVIVSSTANGINATGIIFQDNATNNFSYGTVAANPAFPAINVAGGVSAPGSNVVISIAATGLKTGTFTLIKYTGAPLGTIANFQLSPPPGVIATLQNNNLNDSIDIHITQVPNQLSWNGLNGTAWDLSTANWTNTLLGGITVFQQYTNGSTVGGDGVTFDDTLTNNMVNPQPTNIVLNSRFFAFPVTFNSTLPYSIAGSGGITGVTSLILSNSGSLTLEVSNSFTGGVFINGTSLAITNDSALGANSGAVTLNGGGLGIMGGVTNSRSILLPTTSAIGVSTNNIARLAGKISGAGTFNKADFGTLVLAANNAITGDVFLHNGFTVIDTGGTITNTVFDDVGVDTNDAATLTIQGTGSFSTTGDFNVGDIGNSAGTLNLTGSATLTVNTFFIGSANVAGSTASGIVNQSGGTLTEVSTAVGVFDIGGRTSTAGVGVYNMSGGTVTANGGIRVGSTGIGTLNQIGGTINAKAGINIARIAGSFGTNNLNGGTLSTLNVASSTGTNAVFNFNGGLLQANFTPQTTTWFSGGIQANILAGGAIVDSSNNNVTISVPLLAGSPNGGLTKRGTGTLTLTATNTFTGPITNTAGILFLNSPSTYPGAAVVNGGILQLTTASALQGGSTVNNSATLNLVQLGTNTETMGNLILNGVASGTGAILGLDASPANNPTVPLITCSTLTLNGTNTISPPAGFVGNIALVKYSALAGSGNCTNINLPQGASGYITNIVSSSTVFAVITGLGPGLVWTGTNGIAGKTNLWDVSTTTNWALTASSVTYHQLLIPGDFATFNDSGSGTVFLSNNVGPTTLTISNNAKNYSFTGNGAISGPTALVKQGSGTALLNLASCTYLGNTIISNGTLQVGNASVLPQTTVLNIGPNGTLELGGNNITAGELTGSGIVDDTGGTEIMTVGTSLGGTWNGQMTDNGHGGMALIKTGSGTWVVGGVNNLDNGASFTVTNQFNGGTTVITNGGAFIVPTLQTMIAFGGTATMIVAGGTLVTSNDFIAVGYSAGANGTLIVNNGTVNHGGAPNGGFGDNNELIVGGSGSTGLLTVNGGQVLNSQALWLGQGAGASGTLQLNGGLVQATIVTGSATPTTSTANFNGGTLQATTNSADFIDASTVANIQTGGLILDDGGFAITLPNQLQTDPTLLGGGLIKKGAGVVYLDAANGYTGTTLVTNGLLAGNGIVIGPVVVAPAGNIGAGDAGATGSFSVNNNLTIQGGATMRINVTGNSPQEDEILVSGNTTYGGVLTVTNITSDPTVLTNGNTFQLFGVSGTSSGNFSSIAGSPGAGLGYQFNPTNGVLSVITQTIAPNPTNILFNVSGNTLTLSWAADHLGWILQAQTNSLSTGLTPVTGWFDIPGSGSATSSVISMNSTNPTVFYRLRRPF